MEVVVVRDAKPRRLPENVEVFFVDSRGICVVEVGIVSVIVHVLKYFRAHLLVFVRIAIYASRYGTKAACSVTDF